MKINICNYVELWRDLLGVLVMSWAENSLSSYSILNWGRCNKKVVYTVKK
jgi:hypothetical protein